MNRRRLTGLTVAAALAGCASTDPLPARRDASRNDDPIEAHSQALLSPQAEVGKKLFGGVIPSSNGRACTTCHVLAEETTLRPASVIARLQANPKDPLFHRLDADDPDAPVLAFAHLKKGLVRVGLRLPDNMDVIDLQGQVVTPPDRKIFVWRGVPTVANTAYTAPFQFDGREPNLEEQAQGAVTSHAEGPEIPPEPLQQVAAFQNGAVHFTPGPAGGEAAGARAARREAARCPRTSCPRPLRSGAVARSTGPPARPATGRPPPTGSSTARCTTCSSRR